MAANEEQVQELTPIVEPHVHIWDIVDVQKPAQMHHPRIGATVITLTLVKCQTCFLPQVVELEGNWTLQQVLGIRKDGP